jgi:hypothetical protein
MARPLPARSVRAAIDEVVSAAVARALPTLVRAINAAVDARLASARPRAGRARTTRGPAEMTRWVADKRARRVPTFVIEATGLDTKKKIVAKYGEDAAFEKGKPLPPLRLAPPLASANTGHQVKARPPVIRKRATR